MYVPTYYVLVGFNMLMDSVTVPVSVSVMLPCTSNGHGCSAEIISLGSPFCRVTSSPRRGYVGASRVH